MRHSAVEKKQIIRLVEGSDLSVRQTLAEAGIHRLTYYGWYRRYLSDGFDGLHDRRPVPRFQWNKIPKTTANRIVEAALADPQLSPRELAWKITDRAKGFVSKSSVYRILKAHDLIASPAFIVMDGCRSIRESDEASERTVAEPILHICMWSAGSGSTCQRSWTTTRERCWPGGFRRRCRPAMSPRHWILPGPKPGSSRCA